MRAVQAYFNIKDRSVCAYKNEFDVLVWKLSVIENKKLGFTTVLYTTWADREFINFYNLNKYYDEINYIDLPYGVNLYYFWACAKFKAIEEEIKRGLEFFIVDTDLVFMNNDIVKKLDQNNLFWLDNEPAKNYSKLTDLTVPKGFKYPYYFSQFIRPINTAILRIKNNEIYKTWLDVAYRFMTNNPCKILDGKTNPTYMVTVEQRFVANVIKGKYKEEVNFFCNRERLNFGPEHFHIWGIKELIKKARNVRREWLKTLILIIQQECPEEYEYILKNHGKDIQDVLDNWDKIKLCKELSHYLKYMKRK